MARQYTEISEKLQAFIEAQKIFFVATATADSSVNVSPKGMDALRVLGPQRLVWLNVTGSGNESAAHVQVDGRMTIMFMALDGSPMILRMYGKARVLHQGDSDWDALFAEFPTIPGIPTHIRSHIVPDQAGGG